MIKKFLILLVKFYRKVLTHFLRSKCIYTPSCSAYALEALYKHNVFTALGLIIFRILRCNPFSKGGFDPVPDSKRKLKWVL
ncbi:MAG: membrane protein insertion efficiency factor YidD [Clostridia bacterium]|nr:membrane protein insertion efficiency factor YidD [Clostridia bacterium]